MPDIALRAAILDQGLVGPTQHVDEAGGDGQSLGIHLGSASSLHGAHRNDAVSLDRNVTHERRSALAVVDRAVANHDIVFRNRSGVASEKGKECQEEKAAHKSQV